jgi:hypothetical protein
MISFEEVLEKTKKGESIFFLFEENPYWFTIAFEAITRLAKNRKVHVVIFGSAIPVPLDRSRGWMNSSGGFFAGSNGIKWLGRKLLSKAFFYFRPSSQISKSLQKNENVYVTNYAGFSRLDFLESRFQAPLYTLDKYQVQKLVELCLAEDYATEFPLKYISESKIDELTKSVQVVASICEKWLEISPSANVFVINGRTLYERACYEISNKRGLKTFAFETNHDERKLTFIEGNVINYKKIGIAVEEFWEYQVNSIGYNKVSSLAESYYKKRRDSSQFNKFVDNQSDEEFPTKATGIRNRYVFFTSSNDELRAGYPLNFEDYFSQNDILSSLISLFESDPALSNDELIVRVHPNLRNKKNLDKRFYNQLHPKGNVLVYNYNSNVNSYALLDSADYVITAGSTLTVEAAYYKKPCFSFYSPIWSELDVATEISDIFEIFSKDIEDLDRLHLQALKFALFDLEFGIDFEYIDLKQRLDKINLRNFDFNRRLILAFGSFFKSKQVCDV